MKLATKSTESVDVFKAIQSRIAQMYRNEISAEAASQAICQQASKEALAEFIVEAFNRGWISRFNLSIDDEGQII